MITKQFKENLNTEDSHLKSLCWSLGGGADFRALPPRAKANSFGYLQEPSLGVGAQKSTSYGKEAICG